MKSAFILFIFTAINLSLQAEPVCKSCEKIRDYNRDHPENNYTFYEDYLNEHPSSDKQKCSPPSSSKEKESTSTPIDFGKD